MDDFQRKQDFLARLQQLPGLDEATYATLLNELPRGDRHHAGAAHAARVRVAMFDAQSRDIQAFDAANRGRYAWHYVRAALTSDTAYAAQGSRVVCIFVNDTCDAQVVEQLAALGVELIALRCAGYNHVDLAACREHGMQVVRVPAYSPYAVAEFTVALMLTLNRRLHHAYVRNRAGNFSLEGLMGFDMHGKTVGVVGTGKIGQCVVDILVGFGCRVLAYDKFPTPGLTHRQGVEYTELDTLLSQSDIITLHVPLFPETHHLIDRTSIERMQRGVMLINTSRGGLVDTRALIDGLKSGQLGSAGLDVYEEEAGIFFHDLSDQVLTDDVLARLMTFNNVVVTSHQAFLTREAMANIAETTLENIDQFCAGLRGADLLHGVS